MLMLKMPSIVEVLPAVSISSENKSKSSTKHQKMETKPLKQLLLNCHYTHLFRDFKMMTFDIFNT